MKKKKKTTKPSMASCFACFGSGTSGGATFGSGTTGGICFTLGQKECGKKVKK